MANKLENNTLILHFKDSRESHGTGQKWRATAIIVFCWVFVSCSGPKCQSNSQMYVNRFYADSKENLALMFTLLNQVSEYKRRLLTSLMKTVHILPIWFFLIRERNI